MRAPRSRQVVNPQTGRSRTVYYGGFRHRGKQYWVPGTFETAKGWERAADEIKARAERERTEAGTRSTPTLAEFAGAATDGNTGRLTTVWPDDHPRRRRRKASSVRRAKEGIRPLIREFGDRRAPEITPSEAYAFLRAAGMNTRQYAAQLFDDLLRLHPVPGLANPFRGHDLPPRRPRKTNPEFQILTDDEFDRLIVAAGAVRDDSYGAVQRALVTAMGTSCARPSELFAIRYERQPRLRDGIQPSWIDFEADEIHITSQIDDKRDEVLPKDNEGRVVVLPPPMKAAILRAARISEHVFPPFAAAR